MKEKKNNLPVKRYNINKIEHREEMVRFIIDNINETKTHTEIIEEMISRFKISETKALMLLKESKESIRRHMQLKVPFLISKHIERYEFLYNKINDHLGRTDLLNKILEQKEELLNMKETLSQRIIEDIESVEIENKFLEKNISKEDKIELEKILNKVNIK